MHVVRIFAAFILIISSIAIAWAGPSTQDTEKSIQNLLNAIAEVESRSNDNAVGDSGKAIGRFQIHYKYWVDARMPDGEYRDCKNREYAERVVISYWCRYAPDALRINDLKKLARIHHGGPIGHQKDYTLKYWEKVKIELNKVK